MGTTGLSQPRDSSNRGRRHSGTGRHAAAEGQGTQKKEEEKRVGRRWRAEGREGGGGKGVTAAMPRRLLRWWPQKWSDQITDDQLLLRDHPPSPSAWGGGGRACTVVRGVHSGTASPPPHQPGACAPGRGARRWWQPRPTAGGTPSPFHHGPMMGSHPVGSHTVGRQRLQALDLVLGQRQTSCVSITRVGVALSRWQHDDGAGPLLATRRRSGASSGRRLQGPPPRPPRRPFSAHPPHSPPARHAAWAWPLSSPPPPTTPNFRPPPALVHQHRAAAGTAPSCNTQRRGGVPPNRAGAPRRGRRLNIPSHNHFTIRCRRRYHPHHRRHRHHQRHPHRPPRGGGGPHGPHPVRHRPRPVPLGVRGGEEPPGRPCRGPAARPATRRLRHAPTS